MNNKIIEKNVNILIEEIQNCKDISKYVEVNKSEFTDEDFATTLQRLEQQSNMKKSEIVKKSQINEIYAYQILSGKKLPTKNKIIALSIAMNLHLEDVQKLLRLANTAPLYPRNLREAVIIYGITHSLTLLEINELLFKYNMEFIK